MAEQTPNRPDAGEALRLMVSAAVEATAHPHETCLDHAGYAESIITAALTFAPTADAREASDGDAEGCPHGDAHIVRDCAWCGAPNCCDVCCVEESARLAATPAPAVGREAALAEWLEREMPAGTVIGNPKWWALRILDAVTRCTPPAEAREPVGDAMTNEEASAVLSRLYAALPGAGINGWIKGQQAIGVAQRALAQPRDTPRDSGDAWQPIETAPKDRPVWVRGWDWGKPDTTRHQGWAYWNGEQWQWAQSSEPSHATYLTDWLPTAPAIDAARGAAMQTSTGGQANG